MNLNQTVPLTSLTSCGGCVAKAGPGWLQDVLGPFTAEFSGSDFSNLLVGIDVADDAAVYHISDDRALVATIDFFPPPVDDAYTYGAIAAANALSDVFAMGADVALALNVAAFPETLPREEVGRILQGGAAKVAEAGGIIAGGHTIWDEEPKYGLAVIGFVDPARMFSKAGLVPGDRLYLTKSIGVGTVLSGAREGVIDASYRDQAIESMLRLNRDAARAAREAGVLAATDVTGFGLAGHLWEMASRSGVAAELTVSAIPLLPGAVEAAAAGIVTSGGARNRDWAGDHVTIAEDVPVAEGALLFDPQTSGGLLIACPEERAGALEAAFARDALPLHEIGRVVAGAPEITARA
jgi:selenide,water dikinase